MSARQYAAAGVDLGTAEAAKARIGELVAGTRTPLALGLVGAFGGMVRIPAGMRKPVLVLSTDGVGTKVLVALEAGRFDTVGEDLVNHSINDILVHAARPIAFMDYVAGAGLTVQQIAGIVEDSPAVGVLEEGDVITEVNGEPVNSIDELRGAVRDNGADAPAELSIVRDGAPLTVQVTPVDRDGAVVLGVGVRMAYEFPIDVELQLDNVGGPSAGMMFAPPSLSF